MESNFRNAVLCYNITMSEDIQKTTKFRYDARLAGAIETKWQGYWEQNATFVTPNPPEASSQKEPYVVMDMFPYPSGAGLHVGHPLGYIATDVMARFHRLNGKNVLHALGYDAFGLPAEQYAIQTGQHPRITTEQNISNMRAQLKMLGTTQRVVSPPSTQNMCAGRSGFSPRFSTLTTMRMRGKRAPSRTLSRSSKRRACPRRCSRVAQAQMLSAERAQMARA